MIITSGQQDPVLQESSSLRCLSFRGDFKRFYRGLGEHHESQVKSRPVAESGRGTLTLILPKFQISPSHLWIHPSDHHSNPHGKGGKERVFWSMLSPGGLARLLMSPGIHPYPLIRATLLPPHQASNSPNLKTRQFPGQMGRSSCTCTPRALAESKQAGLQTCSKAAVWE